MSSSTSFLSAFRPEVLVVDDSSTARVGIRVVMRAAESRIFGVVKPVGQDGINYFHFKEAKNAEDAIQSIASSQAEKLSLIICDRVMPGMDGFEMFEALVGEKPVVSDKVVERLRRIPKVIITESFQITDRERSCLERSIVDGLFPKDMDRVIPQAPEEILRLTKEGLIRNLNLVGLSVFHDGDKVEDLFFGDFPEESTRLIVKNFRNTVRQAIGLKREKF